MTFYVYFFIGETGLICLSLFYLGEARKNLNRTLEDCTSQLKGNSTEEPEPVECLNYSLLCIVLAIFQCRLLDKGEPKVV